MKYTGISDAVETFRRGENVTKYLRNRSNSVTNDVPIIEIAYDLQAGTYTRAVADNPELYRDYAVECAGLIRPHLEPGDVILDVGSGEFTTLVGVANACFEPSHMIYGCELSLSRIAYGRRFISSELAPALRPRMRPFVGEMSKLPLRDKSIDVLISSHALEPNRGREHDILRELMRVARRCMVLVEPYYEGVSEKIRRRMDEHAYVRNLPSAIVAAGGEIRDIVPLVVRTSPENPSHAFVIVVSQASAQPAPRPEPVWACPETGCPMEERDGFFFSPGALLAYPIIDGVPILRSEAAILFTNPSEKSR
jgi:ubiquinone/menaquinone biosynthesis C-methylase UbiE